ncbi:ribosomal protection-like ABC-F family protein [Paenibacillus eucommiae]|uniref:ATP-binding cassette subfamily F protein 3 n=1 Tax=Paenibacillus eucommiae TaxID=1355755 RepID=A0ABS4IV15_9BACL|nr:ABC-F type ribosomal protection protein [Paenibacillus eucommiae]MBP1991419.1 ATP-binding cassette subfamily F protein 3 [Paenibacillus eucommiae]
MTLLIKATNLSKEAAGAVLFTKVNVEVHAGERIALFGRNGVGKTTLLNMLTGTIQPDKGTIERKLPVTEWGWLEQQVEASDSISIETYVQSGSPELYACKCELSDLEASMKKADTSDMESLLLRYSATSERYIQLGGYDWEIEVEKKLLQLKLGRELWDLPLHVCSGGQKTRAQMARLMVRNPQLLLLDEPTNHLDGESLEWLEQWLQGYTGTVLFVSHDRYFIDRLADSLIEITPNGSKKYHGGYSDFVRQREIEVKTQETEYRKQKQQREQLEASIRTYRQWFIQGEKNARKAEVPIQRGYFQARSGKHIGRLKDKEKQLERLEAERVEKPREAAGLHMKLEGSDFSGHSLVRMEQVSFSFQQGAAMLFRELQFEIVRGDRLAVLGSNGVGKTTLLKLLIGSLFPTEGIVRHHPQLKLGYFSQELDNLDKQDTLLDCLLSLPSMTQTLARTILGCFLFSGDDVHKQIKDLSMGEKCRAAFLKLYFSGANLLVLDEPTNYLDIDTRERIEQALEHYPGAMVLVSHDRFLIRKLANKLIWLTGDGHSLLFEGTYDEYEQSKKDRSIAPHLREQANERRRLEHLLSLLMAEETPDQAAEQLQMHQVRQIKLKLANLD